MGGAEKVPARLPIDGIAIGGGKVFGEHRIVVTQPVAGTYRAFSSVCTHQGCSVRNIADGAMECPCHGAKFSITDGSVISGPARAPLPERTVRMVGDTILVQ